MMCWQVLHCVRHGQSTYNALTMQQSSFAEPWVFDAELTTLGQRQVRSDVRLHPYIRLTSSNSNQSTAADAVIADHVLNYGRFSAPESKFPGAVPA